MKKLLIISLLLIRLNGFGQIDSLHPMKGIIIESIDSTINQKLDTIFIPNASIKILADSNLICEHRTNSNGEFDFTFPVTTFIKYKLVKVVFSHSNYTNAEAIETGPFNIHGAPKVIWTVELSRKN